MIFAEIDTNNNKVIEKQELFDFFKKKYGRKAKQPDNNEPLPDDKSDDGESFVYDDDSNQSLE